MKIYLIYKIDKQRKTPPLFYAYSAKKEYVDEFMKQRKSDLFTRSIVEMNKSEYHEFSSTHSRYRLSKNGFYTKSYFWEEIKSVPVYIIGPQMEEDDIVVMEENIGTEFHKKAYYGNMVKYLASDYLQMLNDLKFFRFMEIASFSTFQIDSFFDGSGNYRFFKDNFENETDYMHNYGIEYDQLSLYIIKYGWSFKVNGEDT